MRMCRDMALFNFLEADPYIKSPKRQFFDYFFGRFSIYLAASAAKYCEKGWAAIGKSFGKGLGRIWEGFGGFGVFCACFAYVLRMFCTCFAHVLRMFWKSSTFKP